MASQAVLDLIIQLKDDATKGLESLGATISTVGGAVTTVGALAGGALVAGFGVATGAVVSFAGQSQQALKDAQAQLGLTAEDVQALGPVAQEVFVNNWGGSIGEATAMVVEVKKQLGDLNATDLSGVTQGIAAVADTFAGGDYAKVVNAVKAIRDNFPGTTEAQALDLITSGFQRGLDASGDFLDSIGEYSNQFGSGQASAAQFFGLLESGAGQGVLGVDKVSDAFKEFNVRILDGSKTTSDALARLGLTHLLDDLNTGKITAADALGSITQRLGEVDEATRRQTGVALIGTQFEDLAFDVDAFAGVTESAFGQVGGATEGLNARFASLSSVGQGIWRQLLVATEPVGGAILQIANAAMPYITSAFQTAAPYIATASQAIADFVTSVLAAPNPIQGFITAVNNILPGLGPLIQSAVQWGSGLVSAFAQGMVQAFTVVVGVLQQLGAVVAAWLQPHSPPKVLPDIDDWGQETAQLWVDGFRAVDTSAIVEMGNTVKGVLENLVDVGQMNQEGVIPAVLGTQSAIAQAIASADEFGAVSEDAIRSVIDAAGAAGPQVADLVANYFDLREATLEVERAQAGLNRVTDEYAQKLNPLNAQLKSIQDQKRAVDDQIRIRDLQEDIASGKLDELETQRAQLEIAEIQQQAVIRGVEDERNAAVAAEQEKLNAAKAAQSALEARQQDIKAGIQLTNQQNQLLGEQTRLLAQLAQEAANAAKSAAAAAGGGGGGGIAVPKVALPAAGAGIGAGIELPEVPKLDLSGVIGPIANAQQRFIEFKDTLGDTAGAIQERVSPVVTTVRDAFTTISTVVQAALPYITGIATGLAAFSIITTVVGWIGGLTAAWATVSGVFAAGSGALGAIVAVLGGPVTLTIAAVAAAIGLFAAAWAGNWGGIQETMAGVVAALMPLWASLQANFGLLLANLQPGWQALVSGFQSAIPLFTGIAAVIGGVVVAALGGLSGMLPGLGIAFSGLMAVIGGVIQAIVSYVTGMSGIVTGILTGDFAGAWQAAQEMIRGVVQGVITVVGGLLTTVMGVIGALVGGVIGLFQNLYNVLVGNSIIPDLVTGIVQWISGLPGQVLGFIRTLVTDAIAAFTNLQTQSSIIWGALVTIASESVRNGLQAVSAYFTQWRSAGTALIQNLIDGIRAMAGAAKDAVTGIIQSLRDLLPGSEPKDATSPLRGLGEAGSALITNFTAGILAERRTLRAAMVTTFTTDAGLPISQGIAEGILRGIAAVKASTKQLSDEALRDLQSLADKANGLIREVMESTADLARGRAGALGSIRDFMPDTAGIARAGEAVADAQAKLADLEREMAALRDTAANNIDADKREDAARRLLELEQERLDAVLAVQDAEANAVAERERYNGQLQIAESVQNQFAALSAEVAGMDAAIADDYFKRRSQQILEVARLWEDYAATTDEQQRSLILRQIGLIGEAQRVEERIAAGQPAPAASLLEQLRALLAELKIVLPPGTIPGFANGTRFAPGGLAWVGERGPELVALPRGSQVYPAGQSASLARRSGGGDTYIEIAIDARGSVDPRATEDAGYRGAQRALREAGMLAYARKKTQ